MRARRKVKTTAEAKPSPRLAEAAKLIDGGASVESAMAQVGYGPGVIAGLAPEFMGILADAGLTGGATRGPGRPRKAAPESVPTTETSGAKAPSQEA